MPQIVPGKYDYVIDFPEQVTAGGRANLTLYISNSKREYNGTIAWNKNYLPAETLSEYIEVYLAKCDEINYDFDDREFHFLLGSLEVEIGDKYGVLSTMLFGPDADLTKDRCVLDYIPADGSPFLFEGYLERDSIEYDAKSKTLTLTFLPNSQKIKETPIKIDGAINNIFGDYLVSGIVRTEKFIEHVIKLAGSGIVVLIDNNWRFRVRDDVPFQYAFANTYVSVELLALTCKNYAEALKQVAATFGAYVGITSGTEGVFLPYLVSSLETTDVTSLLGEFTPRINRSALKFLKVNSVRNNGSESYVVGEETSIADDGLDIAITELFSSNVYPENFELVSLDGGTTFLPIKEGIAKYLANYFLAENGERTDYIKIKGMPVEVYDDIKVFGISYRPVKLTKNLREGYTEIEAVPLPSSMLSYPGYIPDKPEGNIIGDEVIGEKIIPDGENTVFETQYTFINGSTKVYVNGQRVTLGVDYTEVTDNSIKFAEAPLEDEIITIDYSLK